MKLKIVNTSDKSDTLYSSKFDEHYHSTFGAINESMHVFIQSGLNHCKLKTIKIFEVGFGTGLNTILTYIESLKKGLTIEYSAIELYPVEINIIKQLNYLQSFTDEQAKIFQLMHTCNWNEEFPITNQFKLKKINADFNKYLLAENYDLIYFDAFAPEKQPDLWSEENFKKIFNSTNINGILTTYSSKGVIKTNLRNSGFTITRLPGPVGKRHIIRAIKE